MSNTTFIAALVSGVVSFIIGFLAFMLNVWRSRHEVRQAERRVAENVEIVLVKERIQTYEKLMVDLRQISSIEIEGKDVEAIRERVKAVISLLQGHVFGKFGLVASHETRETILRLRAKCLRFARDGKNFGEVKKASWEAHQMLRSDLGLSQPNLLSAIDRLRATELAGEEPEIEALLAKIHHNEWRFGDAAVREMRRVD